MDVVPVVLVLLFLAVPAAFIGLAVWLVVHQQRRARERQESLASYAAKREWRWSPVGTGLESRFRGDPFGRGHRRSASNVVEGWHAGRAFVAFDYRYWTSGGQDSGDDRHDFSVLCVHLGDLPPVPMVQVAPQGALGRFFRGAFGNPFRTGDPVFDQRFHVRTHSPELAHDLLHLDMRMMLAAYQGRAWRLEGDSLVTFRAGSHGPGEIDAVLGFMGAILDRVPEHAWTRLGRRPVT
ncbi:hypothetical protein [Nocardioides litoris]|uniref:hypothetical protein n=1 Tax=Nocardioides litoris TaxID=1926648 RepID=UPI001124895F|nr:hypothetical protein [Nocardioides litoris]